MTIRDPEFLKQVDAAAAGLGCIAGWTGGRLLRWRQQEPRPLILRPGGMGDLILLCVACEALGIDVTGPLWLIERRSAVWARRLGLDYRCYDEGPLQQHWRIAGAFEVVINTEQRFGLAQATALWSRAAGGRLYCFATNRQAAWADVAVDYDPDQAHEADEFARLLAAAYGLNPLPTHISRQRKRPAAGPRVVGIGGLQSPSRALSLEKWKELVQGWAGEDSFTIAAAEADRDFARALAAEMPRQASLFTGGFDAVCELIAGAPDVFTIDSGFLHIASYYGVPTTAIFTSGRERKWAPLAPGSGLLRRTDLTCQPCTWFGQVPPCRHSHACKEIAVLK